MFKAVKDNLKYVQEAFSNSADLTVRELNLTNKSATEFVIITLEGMVDSSEAAMSILNPMFNYTSKEKYGDRQGEELFDFVLSTVLSGSEVNEEQEFGTVFQRLMSGFAIIYIDGNEKAISVGIQGYKYRGVSEPQNETTQRGSREGFIEPIKPNMGLLRRRLPTPDLVFENLNIGNEVVSKICLCYLKSKASPVIIKKLKDRLKYCNLNELLASGYLVSYLEDDPKSSLFSGVGVTERPDTAAGKLCEGRIGIIVDGSPSVLIVPHLFTESFQSFDDYTNRPYYAGFVRVLKYLAFAISLFFPALFVAVCSFHPQLIPKNMLGIIVTSSEKTPLPIMLEILLIYVLYEITRESSLRVPKSLSQTVGIVGGLVIGDAAVNAGIIGPTSLVIAALSAICAFAIPDLYAVSTMLRLIYVLIGGIFGLWGIALVFFVTIINLCSKTSFGIPFMSPIAPFSGKAMQDIFIRASWRTLSDNPSKIQDMPGVNHE